MRKLLLRFLITGVSVTVVTYLIPGITYTGGMISLLMIVGVFFAANLILKPTLKILMLPIEIATLGLFSLVINAFILWLVAFWMEDFYITSFWFSGLSGSWFVIAPLEIPMWITALVGSILLGGVNTTLYWLTK